MSSRVLFLYYTSDFRPTLEGKQIQAPNLTGYQYMDELHGAANTQFGSKGLIHGFKMQNRS